MWLGDTRLSIDSLTALYVSHHAPHEIISICCCPFTTTWLHSTEGFWSDGIYVMGPAPVATKKRNPWSQTTTTKPCPFAWCEHLGIALITQASTTLHKIHIDTSCFDTKKLLSGSHFSPLTSSWRHWAILDPPINTHVWHAPNSSLQVNRQRVQFYVTSARAGPTSSAQHLPPRNTTQAHGHVPYGP